ncbi:UbiA family prenyltransferase [Streptomyces sp. RLB1-33]|nr:UbiA family prenyltransferase [Streptomyces sp. RLB1-33]QIY68108.1 hypothetical protein HEP84_01130 [Streptomyces sp. RLB1-33]
MGTPEQSTAGGAAASWAGRVGGLAGSCHPGPVVAVTVLMAALAVTAGQSAARCVLTGAAVLTGQLSVGWCNDVRRAPTCRGRACVVACGLWAGAVHLAGVAAAWAYDLRLKATAWSWAPYAVGFAALPAFVALGLPGQPWPAWWVVTAGALLGVGAHLGDVLPDIRGDLATGVRGWPHRLGPDGARLLLPVPLVTASATLVLGPAGPPGMWGLAVLVVTALIATAGTVLGRRWERLAFAAAVAVAVVDVALLLLRGTGIA